MKYIVNYDTPKGVNKTVTKTATSIDELVDDCEKSNRSINWIKTEYDVTVVERLYIEEFKRTELKG